MFCILPTYTVRTYWRWFAQWTATISLPTQTESPGTCDSVSREERTELYRKRDWCRGMLAIIRCRIICLTVCYQKNLKIKIYRIIILPVVLYSTAVERRPCCAVALRRTAWSERGMASVNQTRPHCVNQMGKTHSKPLAARHGRGTAWARHGHGMLCVNRPLITPKEATETIRLGTALHFVFLYKSNLQRDVMTSGLREITERGCGGGVSLCMGSLWKELGWRSPLLGTLADR